MELPSGYETATTQFIKLLAEKALMLEIGKEFNKYFVLDNTGYKEFTLTVDFLYGSLWN